MFGKNVTVMFRERLYTLFVWCSPNTTEEELEQKAMSVLKYMPPGKRRELWIR